MIPSPFVNVAVLVELNLDHIDAYILILLSQGVNTNREIAGVIFGSERAVHLSQFTTSRISKLVEKRLVKKAPKGNDGRKNPYQLASAGAKVLGEMTGADES